MLTCYFSIFLRKDILHLKADKDIWCNSLLGCFRPYANNFVSTFSAKDEKEISLCIKDLNSPSFYPSMISLWVTDSFERKDLERDLLARLLINLTSSQECMLSPVDLIKG